VTTKKAHTLRLLCLNHQDTKNTKENFLGVLVADLNTAAATSFAPLNGEQHGTFLSIFIPEATRHFCKAVIIYFVIA
jgi:hypothetical protein